MIDRFTMNDWSPIPLRDKKFRLETVRNEIEDKRKPLIQRKQEIELQFSKLNNTIKTGNFTSTEYAAICAEQDALKSEKVDIEKSLMTLKEEAQKKHREIDAIEHELRKIPDEKAKAMLIEMKDRYMSFAADTTRVSSMRAMAARFVEEVSTVLKYMV